MTIYDYFTSLMAKLDRATDHSINRIGVNAPSWLVYKRLEHFGDVEVLVHYFFGVVVFAEIV